jgi:hypothetical protein
MRYSDFQAAMKKDSDVERELNEAADSLADSIFENFDEDRGKIVTEDCKLFMIGLANGQIGRTFERDKFEAAFDAFPHEICNRRQMSALAKECLQTQSKPTQML